MKTLLSFLAVILFSTTTFAQTTAIPDANFEQALIDLTLDDVLDGEVLTANINIITYLDLHDLSITSLTGIEDFTALEFLSCGKNQLTSLDLSKNTALRNLFCYDNQLTSLDVSKNIALKELSCYNNQLTTLNVILNTDLVLLRCNDNLLTCLSMSNGNNVNISGGNFNALNNPGMTCIEVDDIDYSDANWSTGVDGGVSFSLDCGVDCNQLTAIPDTAFEERLIELGLDNVLDGYVLTSNINTVTDFAIINKGVTDLTGIEDFTSLKFLSCRQNQITSLDLSQNKALIELTCYNNLITDLNISQNIALEELRCYQNQLSTLDVSNNPNLTLLNCSTNTLTSLDISKNTIMTYFNCAYNEITSLDPSLNPLLEELICHDNKLSSLIVTQNTALWRLQCYNNLLTCLNVQNGTNYKMTSSSFFNATNNPSLTCVQVDNVEYSEENWASSIDFGVVFSEDCNNPCSPNQITAIPDANFEQALIDLALDDVLDGKVLTSNINTVTSLNVIIEWITDLTGIEDFTALETLNCSNNQLTSLNVSENKLLVTLNCSYNELTNLDVSKNTALKDLTCVDNQFTNLDVSKNIALKDLFCHNNQLTNLDISKNTLLERLGCSFNQLTSLNVTQNTNLEFLKCSNNNLICLNARNGNNINIPNSAFNATNNPNIYCIEVDDDEWSDVNWLNKDATAQYETDCDYICAPLTAIPDANFEQYLINEGHDTGTPDGFVLTVNLKNIEELYLEGLNISNLAGIEDFPALRELFVNNNNLTDLILAYNLSLVYLDCADNNLASILDLSLNTALASLHCQNNSLSNIILPQDDESGSQFSEKSTDNETYNTSLTSLDLNNNNLTSLDVSKNVGLLELYVDNNELTSLDLTQNTSLNHLFCSNNLLTCLNVNSGNTPNYVYFIATNNPNLTCIEVDNASWSVSNWTDTNYFEFDPASSFSNDCGNDCSSTLGVDNYNFEDLTYYPNPTNGIITINFGMIKSNLTTILVNQLGQIIKTQKFEATNSIQLNIDAPAGIYFLRIETSDGELATIKVLKK